MMRSNKRSTVIASVVFMGTVVFLNAARAQEATPAVGPQVAEQIEYKSEDLPDPFREEQLEISEKTQIKESKALPNLQIQGTVWGGSFPQAIVNNKVVRVGDKIEGVTIIDINKAGVTVLFDNQQYNLTTSSSTGSVSVQTNP